MQPPPMHGYGREDAREHPVPLASPETGHRPRRWLAVLLSLLTAGVGHVYTGAWRRGATLVVALTVVGLIGAALAPHVPGWLALLLVLPLAGARLVTALDVARLPTLVRVRGARQIALEVIVGWVALGGLASVVALSIRTFLLEAFKIPAGSMRPTLEVGDHLFVDKQSRAPQRGQMMVFEFPENRQQDFVKRVVALAGDVVEVDEQGWLFVNGLKAPTCQVGELPASTDADGQPRPAQIVLVEYLDGHPHLIVRDRSFESRLDRFGPFTVPAGNVFVMGDNRNNSYDARYWNNGQGSGVPLDHFKGAPFSIWLSFRPDGAIAWDRMGRLDAPRLPASPDLAPALARCLASAPPSTVPAPRPR